MTNGDNIRADEMLAKILFSLCVGSFCEECPVAELCDGKFRLIEEWEEWLREEASE